VKRPPGRLVLLGHPVAHSLSPLFQNAALRRAGIPLQYEAVDVPPAGLASVVTELRSIGGAGNVTVPHKEAVAALCDDLTDLARRVGAVNTFWCANGMLVGDNTDVAGFAAAAEALLGPDGLSRVKSVALLGAGGAAAAVLAAVERWPGTRARVHSRSPERARRLCERFSAVASDAESAEAAVRDADLVVNATPVGLSGDLMPIDPSQLRPRSVVLDLVYRRGSTPLVRAAVRLGLRAGDGLGMLVEQGALAFERWFGIPPDRRAMWEAVRL
jgi:shikimate dehydrogenase